MKKLPYKHHYVDPKTGTVLEINSAFFAKPKKEHEWKMSKLQNHYGPWIVYEFIGSSHPAFETAHESNKHKFCMASFPECGTTTLDKLIYLGMIRGENEQNS